MWQDIYCQNPSCFVEIVESLLKRDFKEIVFLHGHPEIMSHTQFRLLCVLKGRSRLKTFIPPSVREFDVDSSSMLIALPNASSQWLQHDRDSSEYFSVVFWPSYLRTLYMENKGGEVRQFYHHSPHSGHGAYFLLQAMAEFNSDPVRHRDKLKNMLTALLQICRDELVNEDSFQGGKAFESYRKIKQRMFSRLGAPLTRESLADEFHLTVSHISKLFRRFEQDSFHGALLKMRMEQAATLLNVGLFPVKEIAERCGYSDPAYFIRSFREFYGVTPGKFRK